MGKRGTTPASTNSTSRWLALSRIAVPTCSDARVSRYHCKCYFLRPLPRSTAIIVSAEPDPQDAATARGPNSSLGPVVVSSGVLSLALLGDALLYAVLPLHAQAFGVSLLWVGVLLSANRFVRVFAYGLVAQLTEAVGTRRMCLVAAAGAIVSTALYGIGEGEGVLLLARSVWGLSYAVLVLVTLAYAVEERSRVGSRVGWSRAVARIGPIIALIAGTWLTDLLGPRSVFIWLAAFTAPALLLAWFLPADKAIKKLAKRPPTLGWPRAIDGLFFIQGAGVDGIFALSITLVLAERYTVAVAVMTGGALLAMRHVGEAIAAPLFGAIGDRYGARPVFTISTVVTGIGFLGVALDFVIAGALTMLVFRGALASLGPATIVQATDADKDVMGPLARMLAWRDLGAAIGPLATGASLAFVSAQFLHAVVAVALLLGLGWWYWEAASLKRSRQQQSP
jgi:DHA1 family inner membrane transport protein